MSSIFPLMLAVSLVLTGLAGHTTAAQSAVVGWGRQVFDSRWNDEGFVQIEAGGKHSVARRSDGSAVAWGDDEFRQCRVPPLPAGISYVELEAGTTHTLALRSDG